MPTPILATKIYIPPLRPKVVLRPRLIERLHAGLQHRPGVTLISAPAGFGKTTLVSEWIKDLRIDTAERSRTGQKSEIESRTSKIENRVAWLSLDKGDNDTAGFLAYLIAALQTMAANMGTGLLEALATPQPPPIESILTALLNDITTLSEDFVLVLDDYHVIESQAVNRALVFLLEHLPPQLHLVILTREDPALPLARLRGQGKLTELRAADLRFTAAEAAAFLNQVMGLNLSMEDVAALEDRTEGWIAGLQLAALSMQEHEQTASFIESFTGSHRFILDYLVQEVLQQQPEDIQTFLLYTSILDRMCGPLCEALLLNRLGSASGQERLEYLERANLFMVPLDNERRWYRYHHLFADLLRQRLYQSIAPSKEVAEGRINELHVRASQWYEDNGLDLEAFHHAAAANDIERAERLMDGKGMPLHLSGGVMPMLNWLESLPKAVLNARPSLWWRHAALLLINGQTLGVAEKLQSAEMSLAAILQDREPDDETRNLIGRIATATATLALTRYDVEIMIAQSRRALEYLSPSGLFNRASANWTLGFAYFLQGDRTASGQAFTESISLSQRSGAIFTAILATIGLGNVQEAENQLHEAVETYRRVLHWAGDKPQQIIHEAHLGLARIFYEWNDLSAAEGHGKQSLILARQYERVIDRFLLCEVFLARLKLAQGDVDGAADLLAQASQSARERNFLYRLPEIASVQVLAFLRQGDLRAATQLAHTYALPLSQARVRLAQGDPSSALAVLDPWQQQAVAKDWKDEQLKAMVLQALAFDAQAETEKALQVLIDALILAEPGGFVRTFLDEGMPMAQLLSEASIRGTMPDYVRKLLAAFEAEPHKDADIAHAERTLSQREALSQRELEVLRLIAQGLSNDEISRRLFLALDTVKGHNRRIFDKLQVQRRTEAVARARDLGLL